MARWTPFVAAPPRSLHEDGNPAHRVGAPDAYGRLFENRSVLIGRRAAG